MLLSACSNEGLKHDLVIVWKAPQQNILQALDRLLKTSTFCWIQSC